MRGGDRAYIYMQNGYNNSLPIARDGSNLKRTRWKRLYRNVRVQGRNQFMHRRNKLVLSSIFPLRYAATMSHVRIRCFYDGMSFELIRAYDGSDELARGCEMTP